MQQVNTIVRKEKYFSAMIIFLYSLLVIIGAYYHEPWRDEANAWLVARNMNYWQLLNFMSYDGNPPLWHTVLYPFAHFGVSYASEFIVHTLLAIAFVAIFMFCSPFSRTFKVIFVLSYYMAYEYAVVARLYSLAVLLLFGIAAFYRQRFKRPIIYGLLVFLLYQTTIPIFGAALALTLIYIFETWKGRTWNFRTCAASFIMLLGPVTFYLMLKPAEDNFRYGLFPEFFILSPPRGIANSMVPGLGNYLFESFTAGTWQHWLAMAAVAAFILIFISFAASFIKKRVPIFFICVSFLWFFYVYIFKYEGTTRHHGLYIMVLMTALWLQSLYAGTQALDPLYTEKKLSFKSVSKFLFIACLIVSVYVNFRSYQREILTNFSGAPEMGRFIRDSGLAGRPIAGYHSWVTSGILPYNPGIDIWYAGRKDWGSYIRCDRAYLAEQKELEPEEAFKLMREHFKNEPGALFLFSEELDNIEDKGLRLIYSVPSRVKSDEHVWLYENASYSR